MLTNSKICPQQNSNKNAMDLDNELLNRSYLWIHTKAIFDSIN